MHRRYLPLSFLEVDSFVLEHHLYFKFKRLLLIIQLFKRSTKLKLINLIISVKSVGKKKRPTKEFTPQGAQTRTMYTRING